MNSAKTITKIKTKRGAASLYTVTFVTMILGILALSFVRIMAYNSRIQQNTDLSQSAFDSAQAGVEDARIAILQYHECLSQIGNNAAVSAACQETINIMRTGMKNESCDTVQKVLKREQDSDGSVVIQETQSSSSSGNSTSMSQSYTCIKVTDELDDYRTTLDEDSRTRIAPVRVDNNKINDIDRIIVSWYSDTNYRDESTSGYQHYGDEDGYMRKISSTVPVISVQLFQTDKVFAIGELVLSSKNKDGTDHAVVYLNPVSPTATGINTITAQQLINTNTKSPASKEYNIKCNNVADVYQPGSGGKPRVGEEHSEFACNVTLEVPKTFRNSSTRNDGSFFLYVTMPFGGAATDISVRLKDASNTTIPFIGVQASVDSTGRANDLYRRIETRLELVDIYYPYPEYELELSGYGNQLQKQIRIANNCWYTNVRDGGLVEVNECPDVYSTEHD